MFILLLIPIFYFGLKSSDEILDLYHCVFKKVDIDKVNIGIKMDEEGMFVCIQEDGSTVPYKYLGSVSLENKNYIVTLDEEEMVKASLGEKELLVSIFEVEDDKNDKKYAYFNGVEDEEILDKVTKKYIELNTNIY